MKGIIHQEQSLTAMSEEQARQFLMQGIELARGGNKDQARQLFQNAIKLDPQNESAWLWMSSVARDNRERLFCLQNVLQINPQNERAIQTLQKMGVNPQQVLQQAQQQAAQASSSGGSAASGGAIPALNPDRLNAVLPTVEDFLRSYRPVPVSGDIPLEQKSGLKYGEALALRQRTTRYALIGAAALGGVLILILALVLLLSGGDEATQEAEVRATATTTPTATNTATATPGVTETPLPEGTTFPTPVTPQVNVDFRGNRNVSLPSPTPLIPPVPVGRGNAFATAIGLVNEGDFESGIPTLDAERQASFQCSAETYYFQIIALLDEGSVRSFNQALALVEEGQAQTDGDCEDNVLLDAAACLVRYEQGRTEDDLVVRQALYQGAGIDCQAAFEDPNSAPLPSVAIVYARLFIAGLEADGSNPDTAQARAILSEALEARQNASNVELWVELGYVEIIAGDYDAALEAAANALFINPLSEEALQLRVDAFLALADAKDGTLSPEDRAEKIRLYGLAVNAALGYLLEYSGSPNAYILLAEARLGEGNTDLALEAVNRVIENRDELDDDQNTVVDRAFEIRAGVYQARAQFTEALDDIETLLVREPNDLNLLEQQMRLSIRLNDYRQAQENLTTLLASPSRAQRIDLQLLQAQFNTELCQFEEVLECDFAEALNLLTPEFIATLAGEQSLVAQSYRVKALYQTTEVALEDEDITPNQAFEQHRETLRVLEDILEVRQTGLDLYYRGLLLEAIDDPEEALVAYNWVLYWSGFYDYPFAETAQTRLDDLREELGLNEEET